MPPAHEPLLRQAVFALQAGRALEAQMLAAQALESSPGEPRALQIFGYALLRQGQAAEALAPLKQAARRTHDPEVETQYAMALQQAGRNDDAIAQLEKATARRPPFPPAFLIYGSLLSYLERRDEAIAVLKRGLALTPQAADMLALLGDNLMAKGEAAAGQAAYRQALAAAPAHVDALYGLARSLQGQGEFAQAGELFERMAAAVPEDAAAQIGLGICRLELGHEEAALAALRRAARMNPRGYAEALAALSIAGRGRFWLRPSRAAKFLREDVGR